MPADQVVLQYLKNITDGVDRLGEDIRHIHKKFDDQMDKHDSRIAAIELARANENGEKKAEIKQATKRSAWISVILSAIVAAAAEAFFKH